MCHATSFLVKLFYKGLIDTFQENASRNMLHATYDP